MSVGPQRFNTWVRHYRKVIRSGEITNSAFRSAFRHALRVELGLESGQHLPPRIRAFVEQGKHLEFVAAVRSALAVAALVQIRPDLVIFDEFQRFRDLLEEAPDAEDDATPEGDQLGVRDAAASRVLRAIRGDGSEHKPALLLLSATPYMPYRGRQEGGTYSDAAADFFVLVEFLYGGGDMGRAVAQRARSLFETAGEELRKGMPVSDRARSARADLAAILAQVMSRTERPRQTVDDVTRSDIDGISEAPLLPKDISVFRHLKECLRPEDYDWAVPLWQSVPLPMQALGSRYQAWRHAKTLPLERDIALTREIRSRLGTNASWPHPRLRALLAAMPLHQIAQPWVPPSLPWWPLDGRWKENDCSAAIDGKLLVFSRFRAVPLALSGLVSYALEARLLGQESARGGSNYEDIMKQQLLAADPDRAPLLALFHPSPILARLHPLVRQGGTLNAAKATVQKQLRIFLAGHGIKVVKHLSRERHRPWELLAMIEQRAGAWPVSRSAWEEVARSLRSRSGEEAGSRLREMVGRWDAKATEYISEIDDNGEFEPLVDLALEAPGIVLARALTRHWPDALAPKNLGDLAGLCWRGLRSYFDAPWFAAGLVGSCP